MNLTPADLGRTLSDYLGIFPAERDELALLASQIADNDEQLFTRKNMRGHVCASGLVLNNAQDRILFIHHRAMDFWMQPGGHFENDPDLVSAAQREVTEETGLAAIQLHDWHAQHPVPIDIHTHSIAARPEKNEGDHFHHDHVYLFVASDDTVTLQIEEVGGARWIPLAELHTYPGLRLRDRFLPKLQMLGLLN